MNSALLLVNMGGPSDLDQVEGYLKAIFNDPAILPFPGFVRKPLASFISSKRAPKVAERYRQIGGSSPLANWTLKLCENVEKAAIESGADYETAFAFRYISPTIAETIKSLASSGINEIRLLPLFPHNTRAMTGSIVREAKRVCDQNGLKLSLTGLWSGRSDIIDIWHRKLTAALEKATAPAHVLFVAHGIPQRDVRNGDDYPNQVAATAEQLGRLLPANYTWSLAYQSRVGPVKWTGPYLDDEIDRIASAAQSIIFMPLSFVADCLETLYDLDIIASKRALEAGAKAVIRTTVFNDDPEFARALARVGREVQEYASR